MRQNRHVRPAAQHCPGIVVQVRIGAVTDAGNMVHDAGAGHDDGQERVRRFADQRHFFPHPKPFDGLGICRGFQSTVSYLAWK